MTDTSRLRKAWIAALRSGDYVQGQKYLVATDKTTGQTKHCCLGVACEVAVKEGLVDPDMVLNRIPSNFKSWEPEVIVKSYMDYSSTLPPDIAILFGVSRSLEQILVRFNDNRTFQTDFNGIADYLEKMWGLDND